MTGETQLKAPEMGREAFEELMKERTRVSVKEMNEKLM
jgi:hypothetical protein